MTDTTPAALAALTQPIRDALAAEHADLPWSICTDPPNAFWHSGLTIGSGPANDARRVCDLAGYFPEVQGYPGRNGALLCAAVNVAPALLAALDALARERDAMRAALETIKANGGDPEFVYLTARAALQGAKP